MNRNHYWLQFRYCHSSEVGFCRQKPVSARRGLNRIKLVKTTTHGKKFDLFYLMRQTLYHTPDSVTSA